MNNLSGYTPITVDGETLYIAHLITSGPNKICDYSLTSKAFGELIKPVATLGKALHNELEKISPDETELSLQLTMGIDNGNFFFGIANMSAEAQLAVKFVWKKDDKKSSTEEKEEG